MRFRRHLRPTRTPGGGRQAPRRARGELTALKIHVSAVRSPVAHQTAGARRDERDAHRLEGELKSDLARLDTAVISIESQLAARGEKRHRQTG